jgi:3',5'-cyclic AMP phosphodiesterase CpdA
LWPDVLFTAAFAAALTAVAPAQAGTYTVYAAGDIARCAHPDPRWSGAAATADLIAGALAQDRNAAVLTLGDHTYPKGAAGEFAACYEPTWGRFKDRTWPTPGNHEYDTPGAAPYFAYFGTRAGNGYYSMQLGSWHVISLNSQIRGDAAAAQLAWLKDDLARNGSRCTLAYWHVPLYSSGGHRPDRRMRAAWHLLYDAGAELVLSGHDHEYERFKPQDAHGNVDLARGLRQFVVGTGGAYTTPFVFFQPHAEVRDSASTGVLRLRLHDDGYDWTYLEASREGPPNDAPDHGTASCH